MAEFHYGRVFDLEEYLLQALLMKYDLRFFWPGAGDPNRYESCSQACNRSISDIPSYRLGRSRFERDLLAMNLRSDHCRLQTGARAMEIRLSATANTSYRYTLNAGGGATPGGEMCPA